MIALKETNYVACGETLANKFIQTWLLPISAESYNFYASLNNFDFPSRSYLSEKASSSVLITLRSFQLIWLEFDALMRLIHTDFIFSYEYYTREITLLWWFSLFEQTDEQTHKKKWGKKQRNKQHQ